MINPRRHNHQIMLVQLDAHPVVVLTADIKEPAAVQDVPDLLVLVQVLVEEHLDFGLVHVAHLLGRDCDLVAVLVTPLRRDGVDVGDVWVVKVQDAQLGEVFGGDVAARVVRLALVALGGISIIVLIDICG
jgi:hypothetical protein